MVNLVITAALAIISINARLSTGFPNGNYCINTKIQGHPYKVNIYVGENHDLKTRCGGAIISKNYVITAASCLQKYPPQEHKIRAGSTDKYRGGSVHNVESVTVHEKFRLRNNVTENDLAVIKVVPPIDFDESKAPIKLFDGARINAGADVVVTSWTKELYLQEYTLDVMSKDYCNHEWYEGLLREGHVCAGYEDISCVGEHGAPMTINGKLAGITGLAKVPDRTRLSPLVYADISYYRDWILSKTDIQ